MPDANLLVPGTGGNTLMDNRGNDVGWPVLMRLKGIIRGIQGKSNDELIELMGMEHRPGQIAPAKTSLKPGTSIRPGHLLRVAYNQLPGINEFLYDWRADIRYSAGQLWDWIVHRRPEGGRWHLVGHSQGGLLIIVASKMFDAEDDFSQYVKKVSFVGSPVAGTLNAAEAMVLGKNAGERLAPVMRVVIRTWPAIYQMLPSWPAVLKADGTPAAESRQLKGRGGWSGVSGIQDDLLLRAREVEVLLKDPLSYMEGLDTHFFWATNRKTKTGIRRESQGSLGWNVVEEGPGDTLVPYGNTLQWLGPGIVPSVRGLAAPCEPHAYLLDDDTVATYVKDRLA